jgi:hypothetical protein
VPIVKQFLGQKKKNYKELFSLEEVCEGYSKLRMGHVFGTHEFVELFLG